jgi:protein SCO1
MASKSGSKGPSPFLVATALLAVTAGGIAVGWPLLERPEAAPVACSLANGADIGGPIDLIDTNGKAVTEADFRGAPTVVFFGFTNCPDVCPAGLSALGEALRRMPEDDAAKVQTALITVDPARDTTDVMAVYVDSNSFPENLVGLTGPQEKIDAAIEAFKVAVERVAMPESALGYAINHTSLLYLMDSNWKITALLRADNPQAMADCLEAVVDGRVKSS